jgi:hypothetical protein
MMAGKMMSVQTVNTKYRLEDPPRLSEVGAFEKWYGC